MVAIEQVPKTALDVFKMLPEGTLCDVIDNVLYMSSPRTYPHQRILGELACRIGNFLELENIGEVIISPFDVYFEDLLSAVQPDILVMLNDNRHILKADGYIHGAPDIIIEVLGQDRKRDTVKKKNLYEKAGVKEYFIVDPANREVTAWILKDNSYQLLYTAVGKFKSPLLSFEFDF